MQTNIYKAIKCTDDSSKKIEDIIVVEAPLQININNEPYTVVMRTPNNDDELVRGLLYAEDIYKSIEPLQLQIIEEKPNGFTIINATIAKNKLGKGYMNKRTLLSVSSCGVCGKQDIEDISLCGNAITNTHQLSLKSIKKMYKQMKVAQKLFKKTGGLHATAAFDSNKNLVSIKEDIGRHNALDKVIGNLLNKNQLKNVNCVLVSGRVSYEIVSKAFIAKIPIIAAVSACSSLAIDYAKEFGICLIGFNRDSKATIYANPNYIKF